MAGRVRTYYARDDPATGGLQLRRLDGSADQPVIDHLSGFAVDYAGIAAGPSLAAGPGGVLLASYGPAPVLDPAAPPGVVRYLASCAFDAIGGLPVSRLQVLAPGPDGLAALPLAMFADGPWCPDAAADHRIDVDLYRIARLRVVIRAQSPHAWHRGGMAAFFARAGSSREAGRLVPDVSASVVVARGEVRDERRHERPRTRDRARRGDCARAAAVGGGLGLALTSALEPSITRHYEMANRVGNMAESAVVLAAHELAGVADWTPVLRGDWHSAVLEAAGDGTVVSVSPPDVTAGVLTSRASCGRDVPCSDAETAQVTEERPWGSNNPRFRLLGVLPGRQLGGEPALAPYVAAVWVGDDPAEADGDPDADGGAPVAWPAGVPPGLGARGHPGRSVRTGRRPPHGRGHPGAGDGAAEASGVDRAMSSWRARA